MPQKTGSFSNTDKKSKIEGPLFRLKTEDADILVLGTAHVSRRSVEDVQHAFREFQPDSVCVELCRPRHEAIRDPERWKKLDLGKVIRQKKLALLVANLMLSAFQKKIGEKSGVEPGAEMKEALKLAKEEDSEVVLADREIRATLSRAWARVGFFRRMWLGSYLLSSLLVREEVDPEEVEKLKEEDAFADLFKSLPSRYNSIKEVIIDERDHYLAESIRRAASDHPELERVSDVDGAGATTIGGKPGDGEGADSDGPSAKKKKAAASRKSSSKTSRKGRKRVLAVVGAGHLPGILKALEEKQSVSLQELSEVPTSRPIRTILAWVVFSVVLILLGTTIVTGGGEKAVKEALLAWIFSRSVFAGLGAILALAHPLSILVTIIMAPIVILFPWFRLWMFPAFTENWLRRPRVEDFERIAEDTDTAGGLFKSLYTNRVLHLIWVVMLVSMGLTIGNLEFLRVLVGIVLKHWGIDMPALPMDWF
ncbi:MAG: TraB/GumN family protein [Leptospiraceae bacterium]|nr:TraB/GumN family protein [Leptospiraceae bacterium]